MHLVNRLRTHLHLEALECRLAPSAAVNVNAAANAHAISPLIYGSAFATTAQISDLNLAINRDGGNSSDTYNWQVAATNLASDWYYESYPAPPALLAPGQSMDDFVSQTKAGGAQPDLTVPIMPYVANLGSGGSILGSYPVSVYGSQQSTDPYDPNFGNGVTPGGQNITDTNPLYNYVANTPAFEQTWIQHLLTTFGGPGNGGVQYFTLGNEPGLWNSTHRDLHPAGETNTELLNDYIAYGSMIKSIDPNAQILGPEEWGWTNYFVDGADAAAGNYGATYTGTNGQQLNVEQWLLQQLQQYQTQHGTRLLDYFTLHYYPQENGVDSNAVDSATELLRNQVTRSLWDPTYVDPSWINTTGINGGKVDLIPMMQNWVNTYYPGTKTGVTEYNFGAEGDMNGATTQADLYGIFGQQGLNLATRWTTPATGSPTYLAMKLWRNYDGNDSGFGDTSVSASVANPDQTDAFAAIRSSDGALTVAVINKNLYDPNNPTGTTSVTVNLSGFVNNGVAQEWQLAAVNASNQTNAAITHLSDVHFSGNSFTLNVPMESVTMFVIKPGSSAPTVTTNPTNASTSAGQSVSFTAAATGSPAPTVQWQVKINGGSTFTNVTGATAATYTFTALASQSGNQYRAVFTNSAGSAMTSAATLTVSQDGTSTALTSSLNPAGQGQAVTFTATVTSPNPGSLVPTGIVTFKDGTTSLGNGTVGSNGVATFMTSTLAAGSGSGTAHSITAVYGGDTNFTTSTSPVVTETVFAPVAVNSVVINANNAALAGVQRSMVDSIVYTFNEAVNLGSNAFTMVVHGGQTGTVPTLGWASTNGGFTWVVTFSGSGVTGNSIADGVYDITLNNTKVSAAAWAGMLAASRQDTFYRLFGDLGGNKTVNVADKGKFNLAVNSSIGSPNYIAAFDDDDHGTIDVFSKGKLNLNVNKTFSGFIATI